MRRWLGLVGRAAGVLAGVVVLLLAVVYGISEWRLRRTYEVKVGRLTVPTDSAAAERGRHLASAIAKCVDCHGDDLGGKVFIDDPVLGRIVAPNLTRGPGGIGSSRSDDDLVRAIRHGVAPTERPLLLMPAAAWNGMSDEDLGALIAYVRSVPPVVRTLPPSMLLPLARGLMVAGKLPILEAEQIDHERRPPARMDASPTVEYGRYVADIGGCTGCHQPSLVGGKIPGTPPDWPPAANLTPAGLAGWSETDFMRALREGKRPGGTTINPVMPWRYTALMSDVEIAAVWKYLQTVPARRANQPSGAPHQNAPHERIGDSLPHR